MSNIKLREFLELLNAELQALHSDWNSRVEPGNRLWADGFLLILDLIQMHRACGDSGGAQSKCDQVRMVILRDPRDPSLVSTWPEGPTDRVCVKIWFRPTNAARAEWHEDQPDEDNLNKGVVWFTSEQLFATIKEEFIHAVEGA